MPDSRDALSRPLPSKAQRPIGSPAESTPDEEYDWTWPTAVAGVAGALVVAVFFLIVDVATGRGLLWTPAVLGSALFLGEAAPTPVGAFDPLDHLALVTGYSIVHGAVFVGFAGLVASQWLTHERVRRFDTRAAAIAALLTFVGLQITFTALGWLLRNDLDLATRLGSGWIATANALASSGMAAVLSRSARRLAASDETHA